MMLPTPEQVDKVVEDILAMKVELSAQPQTEPGDYFIETVAKIHRHETYLSDLIVKVNRWKARLEMATMSKKQEIDIKYNDALVSDPEVMKRKSAGDRKAAATVKVKEESEELLSLRQLLTDISLLCRSLSRKAAELKSKSLSLKQQQKVWESEWYHSGGYRTGMGSKVPRRFAPQDLHDETEEEDDVSHFPTAEDMGIEEDIRASNSKLSSGEENEDNVEEEDHSEVEQDDDLLLDRVGPVPEEEMDPEFSVDEGDSMTPKSFQDPDQDLDALLEGMEGNQARVDDLSEVPPAENVGDDCDLDSLLEDM